MSEMSKRISACLKKSGLTKTAFGKRIGTSQSFVSQMCSGVSTPSVRTIKNICREFGISEEWLLDGKGEMLLPQSREDEIRDMVEQFMPDQPADFKRRLVSVLSRLSEEQWEAMEEYARALAVHSDSPSTHSTKLYIAARDGSRIVTEVEGDLTLPDESDEIP